MLFGDKLRQLRLSRSMTQRKLSESIGLAQSTIAMYESNTREPDFATIQRFARFFRVPASTLFPSDSVIDDEFVQQIADVLHENPKLGLLFDKSRYLSDRDIDAVLSVVNAITMERENEP